MIYRLSVLTIFLAQAFGSLKQSETTLYFFTSVDTTIFYFFVSTHTFRGLMRKKLLFIGHKGERLLNSFRQAFS